MTHWIKTVCLCAAVLAASCAAEGKGFEIRGTKGYDWTPEQCLGEIPILKELGLNFFAPCYVSFFGEHDRDLSSLKELSGTNRWWIPFTPEDMQAWEAVVRECQKDGIAFCFGMNPMLYSPRPLSLGSEEDYAVLLGKYLWFQALGVKWFYLALDDLHLEGQAEIASGHFQFVNRLYGDLRRNDPDCKMIFCPTWYRGKDVDNPLRRPYLDAMADMLDPEVFVFWTGEKVVSPTVSAADVRKYKSVVRHRIILWDNYPVNDFYNTLFPGPLTGRDADICEELYGMMSNPMRDPHLNRLPLSTIADYMNAPYSYNEDKAFRHAVRRISRNRKDREAFTLLAEMYTSNMAAGQDKTSYNAVREKFSQALWEDRAAAASMVEKLKSVHDYLASAYHDTYKVSLNIIRKDLEWMQARMEESRQKVSCRARTVRIQTPGGKMKMKFLEPGEASGPVPGILWIHGGGYMFGGIFMMGMTCAPMLAERFGAAVVFPDYSLAWQNPYPAALEDCYAALEWMYAHADELGIDRNRIVVGGESAGGGLVVAVCLYARDKGEIPIAVQLPLYPMIDCEDTESSADNHGKIWNTQRNHWGWKHYLGEAYGTDSVSKYASPARETDYSRLPPCYTFVSDGEPFYSETLQYVKNLQEAGVQASVDVYPGNVHAFDMMQPGKDKSKKARQRLCEEFERLLESLP